MKKSSGCVLNQHSYGIRVTAKFANPQRWPQINLTSLSLPPFLPSFLPLSSFVRLFLPSCFKFHSHRKRIIYSIFIFLWLISLKVVSFHYNHFYINGRISLCFMSNIPLFMYMYTHTNTIFSNPVMYTPWWCTWRYWLVPYFGCCKPCCGKHDGAALSDTMPFGYIHSSGIAGWYGKCIYSFVFNKCPNCFPQWLH